MRALVTGACGFVGEYLIEHLCECGDEVIAGVFSDTKKRAGVETVKLDVTNLDSCAQVLGQYKPEVIYHLAGIAFVPEAEDNFNKALLVNVGGTNNIIRTCHLMQSKATVLLVSSAEVYGRISPSDLPITEKVTPRPANNYSLSKLMAEQVPGRYDQFGHVRAVIMRPFNHIGPGQKESFVASSFAKQLAEIAKGGVPARIKVGNLEARRDFSDVRDIVRAYRLAALRGSGIYNLGSGRAISIQSILNTLIEIAELKVEIEYDPARMRPAEVAEVYGDISKAKRELGWEPRLDISVTLRQIYQYWRDRV